MWLPRCLRPVGWMPEKMTIGTGEHIPPARWPDGLCGWCRRSRRERQQRVEDLDELAERRACERLRVQQVDNRAQQVAEQVAGTRHRLDQEADLVRRDPQSEQVQVDRPEHQVEDR